ncbi:MFS transporter [Undibacterium piscinae]|uniref:MFS transporter n=1 Tax=Undibacterium piscinae TaxID=2495591 RepID=A0A6M4A5N7_9BURK|nr:MFS transporter [Undibacterium piscinae]
MHASPTPAALPAQSLIYPHIPLWVAVVIACVASFMVVMDGAIVNVALPAMQADLGLSKVQQQWVVDAYLLCLGGCMLLAARASDLYGRKRILQSGLLVFTAASLAGGLASTPAALLIARAIQGFGASALATSTLAVIVAVYPGGPAKARAISMWAASSAIASALGVLIGGLLTEKFGWRWVMFVNVPIGCALIAGVALCMQARDAGNPPARLDVWGALSITLGTAALLFGITQAVTLGWGSPKNGIYLRMDQFQSQFAVILMHQHVGATSLAPAAARQTRTPPASAADKARLAIALPASEASSTPSPTTATIATASLRLTSTTHRPDDVPSRPHRLARAGRVPARR